MIHEPLLLLQYILTHDSTNNTLSTIHQGASLLKAAMESEKFSKGVENSDDGTILTMIGLSSDLHALINAIDDLVKILVKILQYKVSAISRSDIFKMLDEIDLSSEDEVTKVLDQFLKTT